MTMSALYRVIAIICSTVRWLVHLRSGVIRSHDYFRLDLNYIISDTAGSLRGYKRMIELCQKTACPIDPDANFLYEYFISIGPLSAVDEAPCDKPAQFELFLGKRRYFSGIVA